MVINNETPTNGEVVIETPQEERVELPARLSGRVKFNDEIGLLNYERE